LQFAFALPLQASISYNLLIEKVVREPLRKLRRQHTARLAPEDALVLGDDAATVTKRHPSQLLNHVQDDYFVKKSEVGEKTRFNGETE
jgi:hypothetical protein